jgi:ribosomal protein S18 acetylase RimI-like enzyme
MLHFEPVRADELLALSELAATTFTETFGALYAAEDLANFLQQKCSPEFFAKALAAGTTIMALKEDARMVGYYHVGPVLLPVTDMPANTLEITKLYLRDSHCGRGLGKRMMDHLLAQPPIRAASYLYLSVWEGNKRAMAFYTGYGFRFVEDYAFHVGQQVDRDLIYCRDQAMMSSEPASD